MSADDSDDTDLPKPPVPPSYQQVIPERQQKGSRTLERERVDTCDCGGTVYQEEVATGRIVVATWDPEVFDANEFQLETEYEQVERAVRCDGCGWGYTY